MIKKITKETNVQVISDDDIEVKETNEGGEEVTRDEDENDDEDEDDNEEVESRNI